MFDMWINREREIAREREKDREKGIILRVACEIERTETEREREMLLKIALNAF